MSPPRFASDTGQTIDSPAGFIDHTLLAPDATTSHFSSLCEDAVEYGFAAVCVPPSRVRDCSSQLYGSDVKVATVVGFPFGYTDARVKAFETAQAVSSGADELDMVVNLAAALAGEWSAFEADLREVVAAADGAPVKAILECSVLNGDTLQKAAELAVSAGVAYLKTSTGFGEHGARVEDVQLLRQVAAGRARVKASGGIRDLEDCVRMLDAGASRIGTSSGVAIVQQWRSLRHGP